MGGNASKPELDDLETASLPTAVDRVAARRRAIAAASQIGRFVVLHKLGEGGMGTVYAAYDPRLDRKVAIKVVRPDRRGSHQTSERLLKEAQAMARLSHPNIVGVLEAGELGDDVYIALEYVDGVTLRQWLRETPRSWREVVAAFVEAGRGIDAVHAAGLVHRDFKPDNVLVRRDGRIQVSDFGVVGVGVAVGSGSSCELVEHPPRQVRVGTPAYMAPEQYAGQRLDGRADQFAFCVSLWEALYKHRPFHGKTLDALALAIADGTIAKPLDAGVPAWLEPVLRRGLAPDRGDRWPSMTALLAALGRDPAARRRRLVAIGGSLAVVAGIAAIAWIGGRQHEAATCQGADDHLAGHWDADRAAKLRHAIVASDLPYANATAQRIIERFDGWARQWTDMRVSACTATQRGEQSEALLDLRMRCLDRQLDQVGELATALTSSDHAIVARAGEAVAHLPALAACADTSALVATVPAPADPVSRLRVENVEHELATIAALERTGRYPQARARAADAARVAATIDFAPIRARTLLVRGRLEELDGDLGAARTTLGDAIRLGARDDAMFAAAVGSLLQVYIEQRKLREALALVDTASAAVARTTDRGLDGELLGSLGELYEALGDFATAVDRVQRAIAAREAVAGRDDIIVAQLLNRLGGIYDRLGRPAESRPLYERALRIANAQLGPGHPSTAVTRANLCYLDAAAGHLDHARTCQAEVIAILERALGPDHPQVAWALNDAGLVLRELGDDAGARTRFARALAIWEKTSGRDHPDVAFPLINLGDIANASGDSARASTLCTRARHVIEAASGRDHADLAPVLTCLGDAALVGAPAAALPLFRRSVELYNGATPDPESMAAARFGLARALLATGRRTEAVREAREAEGLVSSARPDARAERARISSWLHANGAR